MMDKTEKQIQQGQRAKQLLDDPLLKEAFEYLTEQYKTEIFNTSYNDHDQRQVLWMAYNMLDKIKGHLVSVMETGKLASSELENLTRQSRK
jgi:CTP:phosphocholine cytidylyltransferase-like protein